MTGNKKTRNKQEPAPPLVAVLQALSDPVRLELVRQLDQDGEKACGSFGIDMPKSSMSHHFGILRKAGVLSFEKKGSLTMNRLEREYLDASFPGFLDSVLAAAHHQVKSSKRRR
jgi:DNA-binding transcriptional ArsR family regulator